ADDPRINGLVAPLNDAQTLQRITAERALNRRLGGGCQVPIAGYAEIEGDRLRLRALVGRPDGSEVVRGEVQGAPDEGERLGTTLAEDLLGRGAAAILRDLYA
ncbi:MAG: hydroxymethylbilane synthase, partial [Gammaproteobacteria bacterium]|nr:hydroxymethylbilane synthase [Gammaproteobacteria bacterium]NIT63850.1 hydroxymethylbilane synthase [Gammaproteobacteria bacterium]NIV20854.1 hydroxymethylbilane synthase [Gammaproteobacteria bacterium]NIY32430.1 hydroxymethylbilane synthase [Gammaproteobacteria bacterium]